MDFQIDFPAQPRFPILAPAGTAAAPSYSFSSAPTSGLYYSGGVMNVSVGGTGVYAFGATSFYVGTNVSMSAAGSYNWETRSVMSSPSDGVIRLTNAAGDAFYRLQFGGTTSSFPALKRNGSGFFCVKADDSGFTDIQASLFYATIDGGGFFIGASADVALRRDAANTLALRNGTNAQTFRVYNTYTDASNYERARFAWSGSAIYIGTEAAGTGTARNVVLSAASNLYFGGSGSYQWQVSTAGHLAPLANAVSDLGATSVQIRSGYFATNVVIGSGTAIPAGGTAGVGVLVSSTTNFGVFFGSGAPTLSAAKGSLYLRSDGSGTGDRMYVNTDGSTAWTAVTTAT